ncbi:ESX-4 secretion system ATPase EccB4 [Mycobacterium mantenii]|uniref:ESX-4 secretion system ATPase EccB4 n=1 Tax=Mycobacterium mantenii TaxID=560555 RepID=A0A1X0G4R0_MYCNT|nr:type VII secretion protein EccB [Mycobacterium mantenii]MCV7244090.1 type VII secretion protein EccB [Mycobacterium mantenii]ORB08500.1 type VII secretion protein EccB [Mycobacterium mantenii]BBY38962.1 ESX-4 secretion system ATPase EccB4 [Mycobacterium mantenii]
MPRQPATWLHVSAYRYLLRRIEGALLGEGVGVAGSGPRPYPAALVLGCVVTAITVAGCAVLALLRPHAALDREQIVVSRESGALFVRVGDVWHPVLNLASARLIAATAANPRPVTESDLTTTKRGPLLGIPGAPQFLGRPLSPEDVGWSICASTGAGTTTVIIGRRSEAPAVHRVPEGQAMLVAPTSGSPAYLLYNGHRATVDLDDAAVVRALRLEGRAPTRVSQTLLNAVPEAPPIAPPRIRGLGGATPKMPGFPVGSVLRITRADRDEYYAVLAAGMQRIGQVAADLLRFGNPQATAHAVTVAPDAIRAAPVVTELPVALFPDRAPTLAAPAGALCASLQEARPGQADVAFLAESRPPVPAGRAPVILAQADGPGPALDAVYVPPGRSAYVRAADTAGTGYLITDTGVRFAVHDDTAARDLGLTQAGPAPWPLLTLLPAGPELSRQNASIARDAVAGTP